MNKPFWALVVGASWFMSPGVSHGQRAETPIHKEKDWWKVKAEVSFRKERSVSGACDLIYPEYIVKVVQGKAKVYGVKESNQEEINWPIIAFRTLGVGPEAVGGQSNDSDGADEWQIQYLKFPLSVGQSWTSRISEKGRRAKTRWTDLEYKVVGWEKLRIANRELDAFKIEVSGSRHGPLSYYYAPEARAIVQLRFNTLDTERTLTLIDFNAGQ